MKWTVIDIEADGLIEDVSIIHCLSYQNNEGSKGSIINYKEIKKFLDSCENIIGHNFIRYDALVIKKILNYEIPDSKIIDTLAVSWYLNPKGKSFRHGLEAWGDRFNISKLKIDDWKNLSKEEYIKRCERDVEINTILWVSQLDYLNKLYNNKTNTILSYLRFKYLCLREQEETKVDINQRKAEEHKFRLEYMLEKSKSNLSKAMPKEIDETAPKIMYKKDGSLSKHGINWIQKLKALNLSETDKIIYKSGNPGSDKQIKEWLYSLGWKPKTFKESKSRSDPGKKIPQVSLPFGGGMCSSVKELKEKEPAIADLEGYYMIRHRLGLIKSFIESLDSDSKVKCTAHGFTNTLRLTHSRPVVNLVKPDKFYGKEIRGLLYIKEEDRNNKIMIGSDVSSLEDCCKRHYIYFFDPEYVKEMETDDYDPHLDLAIQAGFLTKEDVEFYKNYDGSDKDRSEKISKKRNTFKTVNYCSTYGGGPKKIAETAKITFKEGKKLHTTYWKRNWAVKEVEKSVKIKKVNNQEWIFNPVSKLWILLKNRKDIFSSLNQSTGSFIFDFWLRESLNLVKDSSIDMRLFLQMHDEQGTICNLQDLETGKEILKKAMNNTNKKLNLNVKINISTQQGYNYAEVH